MIRRHTIRPGDVGLAVFRPFIAWWQLRQGVRVTKRFSVRRTAFYDEFQLFDLRLVDSNLGHTQSIDKKRLPHLEHHFRSGATTVEYGRNQLGQRQIARIRRITISVHWLSDVAQLLSRVRLKLDESFSTICQRGGSKLEMIFWSSCRCVIRGLGMNSDCSTYGKSIPSIIHGAGVCKFYGQNRLGQPQTVG